MRTARTFALILGLLLVFAPAANSAVTVSSSGGAISVQGDNAPNNLVVTINGANYRFSGATAAGPGCVGAGPVDCPMAGVTSITASLLKDVDVWDSTGINIPTTVDLGEGFFFTFQRAQTGDAADTIIGGPDPESDIVTAGGNDTIRLLGGNDAATEFIFTGGLASLNAGPGDDTIDLGDGVDGGAGFLAFIDGGPGNDTYDLGPGNDRNVNELTFPGSGADTVLTGPGDDGAPIGFSTSDGDDTLDGGPGNDQGFFGGPGADTLRGGADEDILRTESDEFNDLVEGGAGDDSLSIDFVGANIGEPNNSDSLFGGSGRDNIAALNVGAPAIFTADGVADDGYANAPRTANIGPDIELMVGGPDNDGLVGGPGTLEIRGAGGDDTISAGSVGTVLDGGAGGDTLNGGPADDVLLGGQGIDGLNGNDGDDLLNGGSDADAINGGNGTDTGDWTGAQSPVTLTPGDAVPDGEVNEGDLLGGDVENLLTGGFNDTVTGPPGPSLLSTGAGDDTITANDGAADDVLCGTGDDDVNADEVDAVETVGAERCEQVTECSRPSPTRRSEPRRRSTRRGARRSRSAARPAATRASATSDWSTRRGRRCRGRESSASSRGRPRPSP